MFMGKKAGAIPRATLGHLGPSDEKAERSEKGRGRSRVLVVVKKIIYTYVLYLT